MKLFASLICAVSVSAALHAQTGSFAVCERCRFADGLALVENTPLAKGIEGRTVKTIMGPKNVPLTGGTRLMYAYPQTEPFANVKVEQIPARDYTQAKQDLIANFEQILTADDTSTRNYALKPRLNGLEIYGLDKKKLEGGTLGIYLFFADRTHTATTIYLLNGDAGARKFSTLEEYAALRDGFVGALTACVAGHGTAPPAKVATAKHGQPPPTLPRAPEAPVAALPDAPAPQGAAAQAAEASAPAASQSTDSYVPPEAAPLVHPRDAANKKTPARRAVKKSSTAAKKPQ